MTLGKYSILEYLDPLGECLECLDHYTMRGGSWNLVTAYNWT